MRSKLIELPDTIKAPPLLGSGFLNPDCMLAGKIELEKIHGKISNLKYIFRTSCNLDESSSFAAVSKRS
jgi:hypothetical protein